MTVPEVDAIGAGSMVVQLLVESPSPGGEQGCGEEQPPRQPQLLLSVAQWQLLLQLLRSLSGRESPFWALVASRLNRQASDIFDY